MKFYFLLLVSLIVFLPVTELNAQAERQVLDEKIQDFQVIIQLKTDGSFEVHEIIDYDFGLEGKHGIIRDIPTNYLSKLGDYNIKVSHIKVEGRDFSIEKSADKLRLRIGEADKMFQGKQRYDIKFQVERGIDYFSTFDEFFWNAVGGIGTVRANHSAVAVLLPVPIAPTDIRATCYVGEFNATEKCLLAEPALNDKGEVIAIKFAHENLGAGQSLSISMTLPKGLITQPAWWRQAWPFWDNRLVVIVLLLIFFVVLLKSRWLKLRIINLSTSFKSIKPKE